MKFTVMVIGKTDTEYLQTGIREYCGRLNHYTNFHYIEIAALKNTKNLPKETIVQKEGELLLAKLQTKDTLILLDDKGKQYNSLGFAKTIEQKQQIGSSDIVFAVGGAYGFSSQVYSSASEMLSLSQMTFSHQLVRLVFLEQLYRAFTILKGEPYHHE